MKEGVGHYWIGVRKLFGHITFAKNYKSLYLLSTQPIKKNLKTNKHPQNCSPQNHRARPVALT